MPVDGVAPANSIGNAAYVVPPIVANASRPSVLGNDDRLSTPGATTSSCAPVFENDASWLFTLTAPTVRTLWYPPGRLWAKYSEAWGWPPANMTYEVDKRDLARHEAEIAAHETFNYALLDKEEAELLGCVYIDPSDPEARPGTEAVVSWWVVDKAVDTDLQRTLDKFVPKWLTETWGFTSVHYAP
jgi:hypothetical protein